MDLMKYVQEQTAQTKNHPNFKAGDTVTVYYKIKEGNKEREQMFTGVVIQRVGTAPTQTFTVRKMSHGVGVERIFPLFSPMVDKIEVVRAARARR